MEVTDVLEHFGILGMKWGRRKPSRETEVARMTKTPGKLKKNIKKLTQPEIDKAIARFRMDREIRGLERDDLQKGSQYVNALLSYGTTAAAVYTLAKSPAGKALIDNIKKAINK